MEGSTFSALPIELNNTQLNVTTIEKKVAKTGKIEKTAFCGLQQPAISLFFALEPENLFAVSFFL